MPSHQVMLKRFSCVFRDCVPFNRSLAMIGITLRTSFVANIRKVKPRSANITRMSLPVEFPEDLGKFSTETPSNLTLKLFKWKKKPKQTTTSDHCCLLVFSIDFKIIACGLESSLIWSRDFNQVGYLRTFWQLFLSGISRQDMPHTWLTTYTWVYLPRYLSQVTSLKSWVCPLMITSATLMELCRTSTLSDVFDTSATKAVQTLAITNLPRKCIKKLTILYTCFVIKI